MFTRLLALAATMAILAGCLQLDGSSHDPLGETWDPPLEPTPGHSLLKGTVLTRDLDPVEGAQIVLKTDTKTLVSTKTDTQGTYLVNGVPPGRHLLEIQADCCGTETHVIELGPDERATLNAILEPSTDPQKQKPFIISDEWTGFLACTARWIDPYGLAPSGFNACGGVDLVLDNATDDDFLHRWTVQEGLRSVVGAMTWQSPGAALGDELAIFLEVSGRPGYDPRYAEAEGRSPLEFRADAGSVEENHDEEIHEYDFNNINETLELMYRVFAGGDLNIVYQQKFTVHWDLYYWEPAPPDATALRDQ